MRPVRRLGSRAGTTSGDQRQHADAAEYRPNRPAHTHGFPPASRGAQPTGSGPTAAATALSIREIENVDLLLTHDSQLATAARSLGFEVMGIDQ